MDNWFQQHDWIQRGRELACVTCKDNATHGHILKAGTMLTGARGNWDIVPQRGTPRIVSNSN
jgi:hypothetical protein